MVPYEGTYIFPSSYTPRSARSLVIHEEAGRLRRKVAATLFFKIFEKGGLLCNVCSCFCLPFRSAEHQRLGSVTKTLCAFPSQHMRTLMPCLVLTG